MSEVVPVAEARNNFSRMLARVETDHERVRVTRNGREIAVVISPDDLASLEETVAVLTDPDLMAQLNHNAETQAVSLTSAQVRPRWATNP